MPPAIYNFHCFLSQAFESRYCLSWAKRDTRVCQIICQQIIQKGEEITVRGVDADVPQVRMVGNADKRREIHYNSQKFDSVQRARKNDVIMPDPLGSGNRFLALPPSD